MKDSVMSSPITASGTSPALAKQLQPDDTASIHANLTERFEILKLLGTTETSYCFAARDLATRKTPSEPGRLVRLKVLSDDAAVDEVQKGLFYLEAAAAAKLSHQNIAQTTEAEELGGIHFYTIEQSPNAETLRGLLDIRSWLDIDVAVSIGLQVADALDHAHQKGVLHLNLTPENILIEGDGRVLVTGFGIGSEQELAWAHGERSRRHHLQYSSPEQIQGSYADCRSDLYSVGIILFEMLTDRVPFDSTDAGLIKRKHVTQAPHSPQLFRQGISNYLAALVLTLLEKNPEWRLRTAAQLQMGLSRVVETELAAEAKAEPRFRDKDEDDDSLATEYRAIEETTQNAELEFPDPQPDSIAPNSALLDFDELDSIALESMELASAAPDLAAANISAPLDDEAQYEPTQYEQARYEDEADEDEAALNPISHREFFEPPTITVIDPPPYMLSGRKARVEPSPSPHTPSARAEVRQPSPPIAVDKSRSGRRVLGLLALMVVILLLVSLLGHNYFPQFFLTADSAQQNNLTNALDTTSPDTTAPDATDTAATSPASPGVDQPITTEQAPVPETQDKSNSSSPTASALPASVPTTSPKTTPAKRRYTRRATSARVKPSARQKVQAKRRTNRPRYVKRGKGWSRVLSVGDWLNQKEL